MDAEAFEEFRILLYPFNSLFEAYKPTALYNFICLFSNAYINLRLNRVELMACFDFNKI